MLQRNLDFQRVKRKFKLTNHTILSPDPYENIAFTLDDEVRAAATRRGAEDACCSHTVESHSFQSVSFAKV